MKRTAPPSGSSNPRLAAAAAVARVVRDGNSLGQALPRALAPLSAQDRPLAQEICLGTLRWHGQLRALLGRLMKRPLDAREAELEALLLGGMYQLLHLRVPGYAAVSETVAATRTLGKTWASGLANAVLRTLQRQETELLAAVNADPVTATAHPAWLVSALRQDWPEDWKAILDANNRRPPFTLRVNLRLGDRDDALRALAAAGLEASPVDGVGSAVTLAQACPVEALPEFAGGRFSVQDAAAQQVVGALALAPGLRVLDACAAPGGKTCHIAEAEGELRALWAVDVDPERLARVHDNLHRLGLQARVVAGDAATPADWWDGEAFDRILLDAPCSGSGVIRRHPDIKLLRRASDIPALAAQQAGLLDALWPLLAPGGRLLYTTCSVLREENDAVVEAFLKRTPSARSQALQLPAGRATAHGQQLLPGDGGMDGFYYACLLREGAQP